MSEFVLQRTMRSVYFECGCFGEYSVPSPFMTTDKDGKEVNVLEWNPQPCRAHKSPENRAALVVACQKVALRELVQGANCVSTGSTY